MALFPTAAAYYRNNFLTSITQPRFICLRFHYRQDSMMSLKPATK